MIFDDNPCLIIVIKILKTEMNIQSFEPTHHRSKLIKEIMQEAQASQPYQQKALKEQLNRKYTKHLIMVQHNQRRQERFINSQKSLAEKQRMSLEQSREYLNLKQEKAKNNKQCSMIEKSKKAENQMSHWERIVENNRLGKKRDFKDKLQLIGDWNEKCSRSTERKKKGLQNIINKIRENSSHSNRSSSSMQLYERSLEKSVKLSKEEIKYTDKRLKRSIDYSPRISTENSCYEKKYQRQEQQLERKLQKSIQKQEKINEARYIKHYIYNRKSKQKYDQNEESKRQRQNHLTELKSRIEQRNKVLDHKFSNSKKKTKNRDNSLPVIRGISPENPEKPAIKLKTIQKSKIQDHFSSNKKKIRNQFQAFEPSYGKIINQKLRNVSVLMRKGRF